MWKHGHHQIKLLALHLRSCHWGVLAKLLHLGVRICNMLCHHPLQSRNVWKGESRSLLYHTSQDFWWQWVLVFHVWQTCQQQATHIHMYLHRVPRSFRLRWASMYSRHRLKLSSVTCIRCCHSLETPPQKVPPGRTRFCAKLSSTNAVLDPNSLRCLSRISMEVAFKASSCKRAVLLAPRSWDSLVLFPFHLFTTSDAVRPFSCNTPNQVRPDGWLLLLIIWRWRKQSIQHRWSAIHCGSTWSACSGADAGRELWDPTDSQSPCVQASIVLLHALLLWHRSPKFCQLVGFQHQRGARDHLSFIEKKKWGKCPNYET